MQPWPRRWRHKSPTRQFPRGLCRTVKFLPGAAESIDVYVWVDPQKPVAIIA
jgi:hypothetical protein